MDNELRDIKPLLEIPDSSYTIFLGLIALALILLVAVIWFLVKKFWKKKKINMQKVYFEQFKNLDWRDVKQSAYEATELGRKLTLDNERAKEIYTQLVPMLESYKYRKEVPTVDEQTLQQYNLLVHIIDESI
ncbi:MAG: Unknown protein [uncultured Sulfurovum sp.]|uniref:DUF4381 domain-containing protein n=1 Tax=uncultured Sulfurovum sp. TaxID=269237 RepID=A0A6S6TFP8_9BACT|nr:MAG: Unknown protein [uncultured Sulfurovum sp.]